MKHDRDLPPELQRLGEQLHDAARREIQRAPRRSRRAPRRVATTTLACLLAISAAAGAAALIATGPLLHDRPGMPQQLKPAHPGPTDLAVTQRDPAVHGQWGARNYTSRNGDDCIVAGWVHNGLLGRIEHRRFRPYAQNVTGACADLNRGGFFLSLTTVSEPAQRTLVYGRTPDPRTPIAFTVDGATRVAQPGPGGAILIVLEGKHTIDELQPHTGPLDPP